MNANKCELDFDRCREILQRIAATLSAAESWTHANMIVDKLKSSHAGLRDFLTSNDLWGGAGSVADSGFGRAEPSAAQQDEFLRLMLQLGELQMNAGVTNVRTAMWVKAFSEWRKNNV